MGRIADISSKNPLVVRECNFFKTNKISISRVQNKGFYVKRSPTKPGNVAGGLFTLSSAV